MADIERSAQASWTGDLRSGNGQLHTTSGVISDVNYTYATRFENAPGTNPEELIAAAHAGCFSMAFAGLLAKKGHNPERIITTAFLTMGPKEGGGFKINKMRLEVVGWVKDLDESAFQQLAAEAEQGCPVSNLLRPGLAIELNASLGSEDAGLGGGLGF